MSDDNGTTVEKKQRRGCRGSKSKRTRSNDASSTWKEFVDILHSLGPYELCPAVESSNGQTSSVINSPKDGRTRERVDGILKTSDTNVARVRKVGACKTREKNRSKGGDADDDKERKKKIKFTYNISKKKVRRKTSSNEASNEASNEEISKHRNERRDARRDENYVKRKRREKNSYKTEDSDFPKSVRRSNALKILKKQDPKDGSYVKGHIRIHRDAFMAYIDTGDDEDTLVRGLRDRNRALDGDLVAAMINPKDKWLTHDNGRIEKTATVVSILEMVHPRKIVGTLSAKEDKFTLRSRDERVPFLVIDPESVPEQVRASPEAFSDTLFLGSISRWTTTLFCQGRIERMLGKIGDLEAETKAILLANGLNVSSYDKKLLKELPSSDYVPTARDLDGREDWRDECVFTIDPATAVDLDDALSCTILANDNYEVGVHISDVTHYLKAFSPLDEEVSKRATTVYLVNEVYHMLPKSLCDVCSLSPGKDKLTFSVVWEMTPEAIIVDHRIVKSIVNSSYKMSYEKAQTIIDEPSRKFDDRDLPDIAGTYPPNYISETVNILYKLSRKMRERRYADGALSVDLPKLQIIVDEKTSLPLSHRMEERRESNRLVEEFMLLANMTVAEHLYNSMPETALLRNHGKPLHRILSRTANELGHLGVHLAIESAASLQSSLSRYENTGLEGYDDKFAKNCRMMVINSLCVQSMPRANYTCSGMINNKEDLRHFALNVPFYTHFTSPIRRYADCVVHRLLFASITNAPMPHRWSTDLCATIATNCNRKKYSAKIAQEKSNELYFIDLLSRTGPTETIGIVFEIKQWNISVILCHVGITIKMNYWELRKYAKIDYNRDESVSTLIVKWNDSDVIQTINVFSIINLRIDKHPSKYSIRSTLLPIRLNDDLTRR